MGLRGNTICFTIDWHTSAELTRPSIAVAKKNPSLKCIIQDLPEIAESGRKSLPPGMKQIEFMAHDFFTEQPVHGVDVYLIR